MIPCANPGCTRSTTPRSFSGLCRGCEAHWQRFTVPTGGFFSSLDLQQLGRELLAETNPTKADMTEALKIMRGPRHRSGPWDQRPSYRLTPLLHGRWNTRLPHVLVGRRKAPSQRGLGMALVHYHLAIRVLGVRPRYAAYLAGCTWMGRKGVSAPKGAEVLKGGAKSAAYHLHITDFGAVGRTVLKAGEKIGLPRRSRWVGDRITSLYFAGLADGRYRPAIIVPRGCFRTTAMGDHPLDHRLGSDPWIPREYRQTIRRASGMIGRQWPTGLDQPWEEATAQCSDQPHRNSFQIITTDSAPDTGWIFNT